jgi:PadR family transcriptional regulator PadR
MGRIFSGPPRKYYNLTENGKTFLTELTSTWENLHQAVAIVTSKKNTNDE